MSDPKLQNNPFNAKLAWYEHIWISLPFIILVIIGGAIGGGCGGASWAINKIVIGKTTQPVLRIVWTGLISLTAVGIYFVVAVIVNRFFRST
jgi:hypothetical protein